MTESGEARLVVLGGAGVTGGFALVGAEIHPDADDATVEAVLERLAGEGRPALVLLETGLARGGGVWLNRLRNEGGHIVITELPPLSAPRDYAPAVDDVVRAVLGPEALVNSAPEALVNVAPEVLVSVAPEALVDVAPEAQINPAPGSAA